LRSGASLRAPRVLRGILLARRARPRVAFARTEQFCGLRHGEPFLQKTNRLPRVRMACTRLPKESVIALIPILRINVFTALEGLFLALAFACRQKVSMLGSKDEFFQELETRLAGTIG